MQSKAALAILSSWVGWPWMWIMKEVNKGPSVKSWWIFQVCARPHSKVFMCFVMVRPFNSYQNPCFLNLSTQKIFQYNIRYHTISEFDCQNLPRPSTKARRRHPQRLWRCTQRSRSHIQLDLVLKEKTPQLHRGRCEDGSILLLGKLLLFQRKPRNQPIQLGLILDLREEINTKQ